MKLFSGENDVVLDWLSKRVRYQLSAGTYLIWASTDFKGPVLGAVGFYGLMGKTLASISVAVDDRRVMLPLVRAAVRLLCEGNGVQCAYVNISSKRLDWIHALKQTIGFQEIDVAKDGLGPGEDLILLKVTPETCRPWQAELRKLSRMEMQEAS